MTLYFDHWSCLGLLFFFNESLIRLDYGQPLKVKSARKKMKSPTRCTLDWTQIVAEYPHLKHLLVKFELVIDKVIIC